MSSEAHAGMPGWLVCQTCRADLCVTCCRKIKESTYDNYSDKRLDVDIYLDVDGTLITINDGIFEFRDGLIGFIRFLVVNFKNCYWLTSWRGEFGDVLRSVGAGILAKQFKTRDWSGNKAEVIDYSRDFIWIEDDLPPREVEVLKEKGCYDKYIHTPAMGDMDYLYKVKDELKRRFNIN
jgi:hypothetical protein